MKLPFSGQKKKTLTELQEEDERLEAEISVARKRKMLQELQQRTGSKDSWKTFSDDGTKRGISFKRMWQWLKTH